MVRLSDKHEHLAATLRRAIMRLNRSVRRAQPVNQLTLSQLSVLTTIDLAGALTPRELADAEQVQPPTMTKIIGKLEELDMVARSPHPTDRRQVHLSITESGRELLSANSQARDTWLAERLAALPAAEREILSQAADILERIARR